MRAASAKGICPFLKTRCKTSGKDKTTMTLNDLKDEVASLGFERELPLDTAFLQAVNRSLSQIYTERGVCKTMRIRCQKREKTLFLESVLHTGGENIRYSASGRAFYFCTYGTGNVSIQDSLGERVYSFSGDGTVHKGFINGEATICFSGEFCYTVCDLTVFSQLYGSDVASIPEEGLYRNIDALSIDSRFLSFVSTPKYIGKGARGEVSVEGRYIRIPSDLTGEVNILYKYAPAPLTLNDGEKHVDIPLECEHILPLLVASYVWLDDDAARSQYYLVLYRDAMSSIKQHNRTSPAGEYITNRWA